MEQNLYRINIDGTQSTLLLESANIDRLLSVDNTLFAIIRAEPRPEDAEARYEAVVLSHDGNIQKVLGSNEHGHNTFIDIQQLADTNMVMTMQISAFAVDARVLSLYCADTGALFNSNDISGLTNTDTELAIKKILESLYLGMCRMDAESILGVVLQRVSKAYWAEGAKFSYRYDVLNDSDYKFICSHGLDTIDRDGLQEGRVRLIIFVDYDEQDTVLSFAAFYSLDDGTVYEYRFFEDGYHRHRQT